MWYVSTIHVGRNTVTPAEENSCVYTRGRTRSIGHGRLERLVTPSYSTSNSLVYCTNPKHNPSTTAHTADTFLATLGASNVIGGHYV